MGDSDFGIRYSEAFQILKEFLGGISCFEACFYGGILDFETYLKAVPDSQTFFRGGHFKILKQLGVVSDFETHLMRGISDSEIYFYGAETCFWGMYQILACRYVGLF